MNNNLEILSPPPLPDDHREKVEKKEKMEKKMPVFSIKEVINQIKEKCDTTKVQKFGSGNHYVVILPEAWEELKSMIGWGKRTPTNVYEQLYQGMGHYFRNVDGKYILIVSHFLYIYAAHRSPTSACISNGEYDSMMRRIEYERKIYCGNEVGCNRTSTGKVFNPWAGMGSEVDIYGHTHPDIGVFFSSDDKGSGYATPTKPAAIFVADPIRKQLKARVGINQEESQILVFEYVTKESSFGCDMKLKKEFDITPKTSVYTDSLKKRQEKGVYAESKGNDNSIAKDKCVKALTRDELIVELGKVCNELLNPVHGSKGSYITNTTMRGKEHIKVDIKIDPKLAAKRKSIPSNKTPKIITSESYDAYV